IAKPTCLTASLNPNSGIPCRRSLFEKAARADFERSRSATQVDYLFTLANNAELVHRHRSTETQMKIDLFKQQTERMIQKGTAVCGTVPVPESIPASPTKRKPRRPLRG